MIEGLNARCTAFIRQYDHTGGTIAMHAKYYPHRGNIYAFYDCDRHTLDDVQAHS